MDEEKNLSQRNEDEILMKSSNRKKRNINCIEDDEEIEDVKEN